MKKSSGFVPECQDSGTIHNWQGTNWDCIRDKNMAENKGNENLTEEFVRLIGNDQYHTLIELLRTIGEFSRSSRISIIIAAYLQLALNRISHEPRPGGLMETLLICEEPVEHDNEAYRKLVILIDVICEESGIQNHRADYKGNPYSISESTLSIYSRWEDMPWD
jgi:hypothetical protein